MIGKGKQKAEAKAEEEEEGEEIEEHVPIFASWREKKDICVRSRVPPAFVYF